jgi:hypothetical protein
MQRPSSIPSSAEHSELKFLKHNQSPTTHKEAKMQHASKKLSVTCAILLLVLGLNPIWAAPPEGALKSKVVAALKAIAGGQCPEDLLSPVALSQCEQHLDQLRTMLSDLGPIKEAQYKGIEQLPNGVEAEVYKVIFTKRPMIWMATAGPNGKLTGLWYPPQE